MAEKIVEVEELYEKKILPRKEMKIVSQRILNLTQECIILGDDRARVISGAILTEQLGRTDFPGSGANKKNQGQKISSSSLERSQKIRQRTWKATAWRAAKAVLIGVGYIANSELLKASSNLQQWQETRIKPLCHQLLAHPDIFPSLETRLEKALECSPLC